MDDILIWMGMWAYILVCDDMSPDAEELSDAMHDDADAAGVKPSKLYWDAGDAMREWLDKQADF